MGSRESCRKEEGPGSSREGGVERSEGVSQLFSPTSTSSSSTISSLTLVNTSFSFPFPFADFTLFVSFAARFK